MKKIVIGVAAILLLTGCPAKQTEITFRQDVDEGAVAVLVLKADGSTLSTETDQKADAWAEGIAKAVEAAASAAKKVPGFDWSDFIKKYIGGDKEEDVVDPSKQGDFERIE